MRTCVLALLAGFAAAGGAAAHPLDEVVQGAYLTLAPGAVRLELDISAGTEVVAGVLRGLDPDGDRRISDAEARAFGTMVLKASSLTLDGAPAAWRLERVAVPAYDAVRMGGDTIKVYAVAARPEKAGEHGLTYENRYQPAKSQCAANVFLQPAAGWRFRVLGQEHGPDGRRLSVRYEAAR